MESNERLKLALDFVMCTDKCIFLTGKAGTGKTTFLQNLKKNVSKRMAIVAPTGVAAINAGGVTIHSFFQMPFGPVIPFDEEGGTSNFHLNQQIKRFRRDKIKLIKSLDLLVIDEISMVRADLLDGIDQTLRYYRHPEKPFGGVQVLMIGDLHQLPPVVKDEDWQILRPYYPDLYFFNSRVYSQSQPVCIELNHIYRQSDPRFIDLLNSIRENRLSQDILDTLNQRHIPNFQPAEDEDYIILTTHNNSAQEINRKRLASLKSTAETFKASIQNDFPEYSFPTDEKLELKIGAQVMFVKNDTQDKLYYNGKIGKVTSIDRNEVKVKCPGDFIEISVKPVEWQNLRYELNESTKELEEKVAGKFSQFPLKLAWAITIHKSQGLTFERAIIDAGLAFAHGQVYVALSRCKSFEGLVLSSSIGFNSIRTDHTVRNFTDNLNQGTPCEEFLRPARAGFQQSLLFELIDFRKIRAAFFRTNKIMEDHYASLDKELHDDLRHIKSFAEEKIYPVAESFGRQLQQLFQQHSDLPEDQPAIQERVQKASAWFNEKITQEIFPVLSRMSAEDIDNKNVKELLSEALHGLRSEVLIKLSVLNACAQGFNTLEYMRVKVNAEIDAVAKPELRKAVTRSAPKNLANARLYQQIKSWRDELAAEQNVPVYQILPQKTLLEICSVLPASMKELEKIKGIGKTKLSHYGRELLHLINDYCADQGISVNNSMQFNFEEKQESRQQSHEISFKLFREGRSIQQIAAERGYVASTIEGHLARYIESGELNIDTFVEKAKRERILAYLKEAGSASMTAAKAALGDEVSYTEIRAVAAYMKSAEI